MARRMLEDMVRVKHIKKEIEKSSNVDFFESVSPRKIPKEEKTKKQYNYTKNRTRYLIWTVAFLSLIICFFSVSSMFAKANIVINPKIEDVSLNENLSASKDSTTNGLSFNLVVISGAEDKTINSTDLQDVKLPATGTVIIYNIYNTLPQSLSADTRLEGSNGKIYKTKTKIVIPGKSKSGTPGQVQVDIYAAEAGPDYNSQPLDFKISGFKGTAKYDKFYARSKNQISGGYIGKAPIVSDADRATAVGELKIALQSKLLQKITVPDGFVLFKNSVFLSANDSTVSSVYNQDNSLTLTLNGTLYGIIFNEQQLMKKIALDNVDQYSGDGSDLYIPGIENLNFSISTPTNSVNDIGTFLGGLQNLNFNLSGPAKITWKVDISNLTNDLLGKSKKDFNKIVSQYPNINSASLNLSPGWMTSIPNQTKNIKINVNYPQ